MGYSLSQKIIRNHLISGEMEVREEIGIRIDQTLTQDATGTMAYLEFEAMGIKRYTDKTKLIQEAGRDEAGRRRDRPAGAG